MVVDRCARRLGTVIRRVAIVVVRRAQLHEICT